MGQKQVKKTTAANNTKICMSFHFNMIEAFKSRVKLHVNQFGSAYLLQFYMKIEKVIVFDENVLSEPKSIGCQSGSGLKKFYLSKCFQRLQMLSILKRVAFP